MRAFRVIFTAGAFYIFSIASSHAELSISDYAQYVEFEKVFAEAESQFGAEFFTEENVRLIGSENIRRCGAYYSLRTVGALSELKTSSQEIELGQNFIQKAYHKSYFESYEKPLWESQVKLERDRAIINPDDMVRQNSMATEYAIYCREVLRRLIHNGHD